MMTCLLLWTLWGLWVAINLSKQDSCEKAIKAMLEFNKAISKVELAFSDVLYFDDLDKSKPMVEEFIMSIHSLKDVNDHNMLSFIKLFSISLSDIDYNDLYKLIEGD